MLKFIHVSDIHLDTSFYTTNPKLRVKLRNSLRDAFKRVIEACINERVDALLIAGDLFDNDQLSFQTEAFLIEEIRRLQKENIQVIYATGNHDPGDKRYRANLIKWPENLILINDDRLQEVDIIKAGEIVGKVMAVGHLSKTEDRNLIKDFPQKKSSIPHIGLVHAMVTSATGVDRHDRYLPCSLEDLKEKNYDYWALGHIHQRQSLGEDIYYCGNLQGRNPKETGPKGGNLVEIDAYGNTVVKPLIFSNIQWETLTIKGLDDIKEYQQLKEYVILNIDEFLNQNKLLPSDLILRLELEGRCYLKRELETDNQQLQEDILINFGFCHLDIKTNLLNPIKVEDYKDGNNVLSKVLKLLDGLKEEDEVLETLLKIKFTNKRLRTNEEKKQYILELIKGLEEEALNRMVGE